MSQLIHKCLEFLSLRNKEKKEYESKVDRNDRFILDLLNVLAKDKPHIYKCDGSFYFTLKGFGVIVSAYSYIYITGHDLEHSSTNIRSSFGYAVRSIFESQES